MRREPRELSMRAFLTSMLVFLGVVLFVLLRLEPPSPLGLDAPLEQFSAARAEEILCRLVPKELPRPAGTPENRLMLRRIGKELKGLGLEPQRDHALWMVSPRALSRLRNLSARIEGQEQGPAVLLMAHHDSVSASPGVADNASSVAAVLETARAILREGPTRNPLILFFPDGEEEGMLGAKLFLKEREDAGEIGFVINADAAGTSGRSMLFETSKGNKDWIRHYARNAPHPETSSVHVEVYQRLMAGRTDLTPFLRHGIQGANFAFIRGQERHYHTPGDNFENLDRGSLQHQGENLLALTRAMLDTDLSRRTEGNAAFMDIVGLMVVGWPDTWSLPFATGLLVYVLLGLLLALRTRAMRPGQLVRGLVSVALAMVAAEGALERLFALYLSFRGDEALTHGAVELLTLCAWLLVFGVVGLVSSLMAARAGSRGLLAGVVLAMAILATVTSIHWPASAIVFILPAASGAFALLLMLLASERQKPRMEQAACLLPALVTALVLLKYAFVLQYAFGLEAVWLLPVTLTAAALSPMAAVGKGSLRLRNLFLAVLMLAAAVSLFLALQGEVCREESPCTSTLEWLEKTESEESWVIAVGGMSAEMRGSHRFTNDPVKVKGETPGWRAAVGSAELEPPTLELQRRRRDESGWGFEAKLKSPRGASVLELSHFDEKAVRSIQLEDVAMAGVGVEGKPLELRGLGPGGVVLKVELWGGEPWEAEMADVRLGLPALAEEYLKLRGKRWVPRHEGDRTRVTRKVRVEPPEGLDGFGEGR